MSEFSFMPPDKSSSHMQSKTAYFFKESSRNRSNYETNIHTKHFHWSGNRHSCLGKLSRLKNKHTRKNVHASRLNAIGGIFLNLSSHGIKLELPKSCFLSAAAPNLVLVLPAFSVHS